MSLTRDLPNWIALGIAGVILWDAIMNRGCKHWIPIFDMFEGCGCDSFRILGPGAVDSCEWYVNNIKVGVGPAINRTLAPRPYATPEESGLDQFLRDYADKIKQRTSEAVKEQGKKSTQTIEGIISELIGKRKTGGDTGLSSGSKDGGAPFGLGTGAPEIIPRRVRESGADPLANLEKMIQNALESGKRKEDAASKGQYTLDELIQGALTGPFIPNRQMQNRAVGNDLITGFFDWFSKNIQQNIENLLNPARIPGTPFYEPFLRR